MNAEITGLVVNLYEALLDGNGLVAALAPVAARIGASSHAVHLIRYRDGRPVGSSSAGQGGVAGEPLEAYARYWVRHDPWARAGAGLPPGVHDISAHVPPDVLRQSRIWNEWGRVHDAAFHALGVPLRREGEAVSGVFFHRRESEAPFAARDGALLEALFPHLQRVVAAEEQLAAARTAPGLALCAALDALTDGAAVLDERRSLVFANAALQRMAERADGLSIGAEGVQAPDPALRLALSRAVTAALAAAEGRLGLLPSAGTVALPRPSGAAPWLVRAVPVVRGAVGLPGGFRGAMLLVSDGARRTAPSAALLARLYGLTPAEAALAATIAAGGTPADHAKRRKVSVETVRTQLAAIRRKTGCRRMEEVTALLARLPG